MENTMSDIKQLLTDEKQRIDADGLLDGLDSENNNQQNPQGKQNADRLRKAREQYTQALDAYLGTL
jgi:hypothetical protein